VVDLSGSLEGEELVGMLTHELCHALDDAEGLSSDGPGLGQWTNGPLGGGEDRSETHQEREVFANLCEAGPVTSVLMACPCADGVGDLWSLYLWLSTGVWTGELPLPLANPDSEPTASWVAHEVPDSIALGQPGPDPVLQITYRTAGETTAYAAYVNLYTGHEAEPSFGRVPDDDLDSSYLPTGIACLPGEPVGWAAGPGAAVCTVEVDGFGSFDRVIAWDGSDWHSLADGCYPAPTEPRWLFDADDAVWAAGTDGAEIAWRRVSP
jgi:hypothetical protein